VAWWRAFAHLIWATYRREPLIGVGEEALIRRSFATTLAELDVIPHAVGVMPDHVHVACSIPPARAVVEVVKRLKGASSHAVNHGPGRDPVEVFRWQGGYGYVNFGERHLPVVAAYVREQRARHAARALWPTLERAEAEGNRRASDDDGPEPASERRGRLARD
jgi:putative transposase